MSSREYSSPRVVEPRREIVEVRDADGVEIVLVAEAVPTFTGRSPVDTTGANVGDVLVVGNDGVLRPRSMAEVVPEFQRGSTNHLVESFDDVPTGLRVGEWVTLISGPEYGAVYRVEER